MCLGKKSGGSTGANVPPPAARVDPVNPQGTDLLRNGIAALERIAGVRTSARGVTGAANVGQVQVNGPGSALPATPRDTKNPGPIIEPVRPWWETPGTTVGQDESGGGRRGGGGGGNEPGRPGQMPVISPFGGLGRYLQLTGGTQSKVKKPKVTG